jgi:FlaA1/EpsC-like NDP-sugar epimerase
MRANPQLGLEPVAFLDDDWRKYGARIHGVPIVGGRQKIANLMSDYAVQQAIIAMPTASGKMIRELTQLCRDAHLPVRTVPGVFELLDGSVTVNQLRPIEITDLLRREPIQSNLAPVLHLLKGKRVLVTGAGGSIGSELCRQIARCEPGALILLGHGENSIFDASNEFYSAYPQLTIQTVVADIRDSERLHNVFARQRPDIVFHTAAHKHVPLMEENVEDAVSNNVIGTRNMLAAAAQQGVNHFVLISTDKAVNPSSVMGTTKRIAELLVQETAKQTGRNFVVVRFGNVLGSRGSVVPTFKKQIAQGGPITVTHPEVRRYFMTIPEAIQLVLQATTLGKGGEIFFLEMGEPVKIVDLARDLIRLSGLEEGQDVDIVFTGLRPGEKLFEELTLSAEEYGKTAHDKIYVNHNGYSNCSLITDHSSLLDALIAAAQCGEPAEVRRLLREIVPEYRPAETVGEPVAPVTALVSGSSQT